MKRREFVLLRYSVFFTLLYILVGCTENRVQMQRLQVIDSLMEAHPQAAYDSLCRFDSLEMEDAPRKVAMKCRMLMAKAQNKLYLSMPTDSIFQEVVDYYDSKGSDNEKMQAYYLMGCVYRDQKEAPRAMMSYKKAVEYADTLSKKCDYCTLSKVYGQMAEIYSRQYLHSKAVENFHKYSDYSFLSNNKKDGIQGLLFASIEYYSMGDTLKALNLQAHCRKLYLQSGMRKEAALSYPRLIYTLLNRANYKKAAHYMSLFESQSGLFDSHHNIKQGHEHYYKAKGLYFLGIHRLDSSEYYFRKLGAYGMKYESCNGLLSVFSKLDQKDSVKKYAVLSEQEMDKILNSTQADAVIQANSLYDYTRLQKKIDEEILHKERNKYLWMFICFMVLCSLGFIVGKYKRMKNRMSQKIAKVNQRLEKASEELSLLQENKDIFIHKKQEEIAALQDILREYREKYEKYNLLDKEKMLMESDIVVRFMEMSKPKRNHIDPVEEDWQELYDALLQYKPLLFERIRKGKLSPQEFQICILAYLGIDNTAIAFLINTTTKNVSNAKQKINRKLFDDKRASTLFSNLLNI